MKKVITFCLAFLMMCSLGVVTGTGLVSASELSKNEVQNASNINVTNSDDSILYRYEEAKSQEALNMIKKKYSGIKLKKNKSGELIITSDDEQRVREAVKEYLKAVNYNSLVRGVGKNWWNSTKFVSQVIDVGLIALGLWTTASTYAAVRTLIRNNRKNITRMVEKEILKQIGLGVSGIVGAAINIALTISSTSIGGVLAEGFDRADGKNDNYIFA